MAELRSLWLDVQKRLQSILEAIPNPRLKSVGLGVRDPNNQEAANCPYIDITWQEEAEDDKPAEVQDTKRSIVLIIVCHGNDVPLAEYILHAVKAVLGDDPTLGQLVIDCCVVGARCDQGLWPNTTYEVALDVHFQCAFGDG